MSEDIKIPPVDAHAISGNIMVGHTAKGFGELSIATISSSGPTFGQVITDSVRQYKRNVRLRAKVGLIGGPHKNSAATDAAIPEMRKRFHAFSEDLLSYMAKVDFDEEMFDEVLDLLGEAKDLTVKSMRMADIVKQIDG